MAPRIQHSRVDWSSTHGPSSPEDSSERPLTARETPGWIHALARQWQDERRRPQAPLALGRFPIDKE